jgi:N-acetylglucosamine-6-sulfatase
MRATTLQRLVVAVVASGLVLCTGITSASGKTRAPARPNFVFVLTDDLAWNLVDYMPHVQALQRQGVTFSNYVVTDSLCCPSRSSIFTGQYPHDTGVFTNTGDDGGFAIFHALGEERHTFATRLHGRGYLTALMGKYLNGYMPGGLVDGKRYYVPPGWDEWDVAGNGYAEFNYNLNENGTLVHYGSKPRAYLTDVIARKGSAFIARAAHMGKPFMLEIATFAPHGPYTPAPRNANDFPGLQAPRSPAFDETDVSDKPAWLSSDPSLTADQISRIDAAFRKRAQAVEAVDELIGRLEQTLAKKGLADDTYIVFSSDNGFHMGEHRLMPGKMTAFETDIRVPLIITGPGVRHGRTTHRIAQNIDLYPTVVRLARGSVPPWVDGVGLQKLLRGHPVPAWSDAALVEHHGPDTDPSDPDQPPPGSGNPTTYEALRQRWSTYVEYANGESEYYDLRADPYELTNTASSLSPADRDRLHTILMRLENCHSAVACRQATR